MDFQPTPESMPPSGVRYRLKLASETLSKPNLTPLNPLSFILRAALICPDHKAIIHLNVPHPVLYSYAVWAQRVQNLAYALIKAGIQPGDRVAVLAPNCPLIAGICFFKLYMISTDYVPDAHQGVLAARAVLVAVNTRLLKPDIEYIISHSGAKLVLVDHEYASLVKDCALPVVVSNDTGRIGDPYETFLREGRIFSKERSWAGLLMEPDENANATLNYTYIFSFAPGIHIYLS